MKNPSETAGVPPLVRVTGVEVVDGFVVRLCFDDGTEREVDLEGLLWGPMFEPLKEDPRLFRRVRVDENAGTIVWPNGADLDPVVLHGSAEPAATDERGRSGPIR